MNKTLLILLPFLILCGFMAPEKGPKNDLQNDNLKGAVKTLTESAYKATYGDSGKAGKGNFEHKYVSSYDKSGFLKGSIGYNADKTISDKTTCTFDKKGNKTEMVANYADGSLKGKTTYTYDNKGYMVESKEYDGDNKLTDRYTFKYDKKGNQEEMKDYNNKDSLTLSYKYTWDDKGNNTKIEGYNGIKELISTITTVYDDNGNYVNWKGDYKGVKSDDFAYSYKYIYDKTGNWTQRLKFQNGYEIEIVDRVVEYYE